MQDTKSLFESLGVSFVNRSFGMATTGPVTLDCLEKAISKVKHEFYREVIEALEKKKNADSHE